MTDFEEFVEDQLKDIEIPEVGEGGYGAHLVELWEHLAWHVAADIAKTTEKRGFMPDGIRYLMPGGMSLEVWFDHHNLTVQAKAEYPAELIKLLLAEVADDPGYKYGAAEPFGDPPEPDLDGYEGVGFPHDPDEDRGWPDDGDK